MKKFFTFYSILILSLVFISCSSEDKKESESITDLIVGNWKLSKQVYVCSSGSEQVFEFNSCAKQSGYIFSIHSNPNLEDDGDLLISTYYLENGNCSEDDTQTGTWSVDGDNLTIKMNGQPTVILTLLEVTENTLWILENDDRLNDICNGNDQPLYKYVELIKEE